MCDDGGEDERLHNCSLFIPRNFHTYFMPILPHNSHHSSFQEGEGLSLQQLIPTAVNTFRPFPMSLPNGPNEVGARHRSGFSSKPWCAKVIDLPSRHQSCALGARRSGKWGVW